MRIHVERFLAAAAADDPVGACSEDTALAAWQCVTDDLERQACPADDLGSSGNEVVASCDEIAAATWVEAFNTLTPAARDNVTNRVYQYADPRGHCDACFPSPLQ